MTGRVSGTEQRLISRAWRSVAVQTAIVFAVAMVGLDLVAIGVVLYASHADSRRTVDQALADPDVLTAPPWLMSIPRRFRVVTLRRKSALTTSPGRISC